MPPIDLVGTLPLSSLNVGLSTASVGLGAEATKLAADIADLAPAVEASLEVSSHFPPNPASFSAVIGAGLSAPELAALLNPTTFATISAEANTAVLAKIGFIDGQIGALANVKGALAGGLDAGGISGWSYSGRCDGFGPVLDANTRLGFGSFGPADQVSGLVIVTQSLSSWGQLAKSMAANPAPTGDGRLVSHGERTGAQWNSGVASLALQIDAFLSGLEGMKANLEAASRVSVGLDLPDPSVVVDAGTSIFGSVGIGGLLDNLVNVRTDVTGAIGAIQADVDATISLQGEISGQLAAGGFSVWSYSGHADGFGSAVTDALGNGLPGGSGPGATVYGLALAGAGPSMSLFSGIFGA